MEQGFQNQSELGWNPNYDLCDLRQVSSPLWASISACEKWASGSWGLLGHYENEVRWGLKSAQPFHGVSQNPQTLPVMLPWNRALVRIKQNHECKSTLKSTEQLLGITFWSWGLGRGRSIPPHLSLLQQDELSKYFQFSPFKAIKWKLVLIWW